MYQYRHILTRMRQGDSDREIARSKTMGRKKIAQVRELASARGWLAPATTLPDDAVLASALVCKEPLPSTCISTLEPWRAQIGNWCAAGIQGTTIHATLVRNHGYTGSYSAVYRFLHQLVVDEVADVPLRLVYSPVQRGESGMFVVTADTTGWKSRYLGPVRQLDGLLPEPRITSTGMQGFRMLADTATADFFFFPGAPNREYWILGQSADGRHLAIAMPQENAEVADLHDAVFNLKVINLEQGKRLGGVVATMPPMSGERSYETFYGKWYSEHCSWTPLLTCK